MVHRDIRAGVDGADCFDDEPKAGSKGGGRRGGDRNVGREGEPAGKAWRGLQVVRSKKVALKNILVGKIKDNFELWESDKMPFEEILIRVKEQARAKKLEKEAQRGRANMSLGATQANGHRPGQEFGDVGRARQHPVRRRRRPAGAQ